MTKSDKIKKIVAEYFGITVEALEGPSRKARVARPRLVAYLMLREFTKSSFPQIAMNMGYRDHTTIMSGIRAIPEHISRDEDLAARVEMIREAIRNTFDPIPFVRRSKAEPIFQSRRAA